MNLLFLNDAQFNKAWLVDINGLEFIDIERDFDYYVKMQAKGKLRSTEIFMTKD